MLGYPLYPHRGGERPEVTPSLAEQYGSPSPDDPDKFEVPEQTNQRISADQVLDKYLQALGGAQQVAKLTSFVGRGTYEGYDTDRDKVPVDVFAKAPDQRAMIIHVPSGDKITTYDGREGWIAEPDTPAPLMALTGDNLDGARVDAILTLPLQVKRSRSQWMTGTTDIDDRAVEVVEGFGAGQSPLKLYFDRSSGLLVRMVRYANTLVGQVTTQLDYSHYRAIADVMLPFQWTVTWLDGHSTTQLSAGAPLVAASFARARRRFRARPSLRHSRAGASP
jgi:hypothetical protein